MRWQQEVAQGIPSDRFQLFADGEAKSPDTVLNSLATVFENNQETNVKISREDASGWRIGLSRFE
jgi:hypothetical protein